MNGNIASPAMPVSTSDMNNGHQDGPQTWQFPGLSKREYTAIHLGVPDSGYAELDAMIRKANRARVAESAMRGILENHELVADERDRKLWVHCSMVADLATQQADALLSALEAKP